MKTGISRKGMALLRSEHAQATIRARMTKGEAFSLDQDTYRARQTKVKASIAADFNSMSVADLAVKYECYLY